MTQAFFDSVRTSLFRGHLSTTQVDGMERIITEARARAVGDRWLAYILATVFHETGAAMQPVHERDNASGTYLRGKPYYPWYGRGLVQITWERNYAKFSIKDPDEALAWPTALHVLFTGMLEGQFTGRRLDQYFNPKKNDPINARRIVNGLDKAKLIAGYYEDFLHALSA